MKKTYVPLIIALFASLAIVTACSKEKATRNLTITTTMSKSPISVNRTMAASLVFNSGYVIVREVDFKGTKSDQTILTISEEKITTIDLVTGVASPLFDMNIPAGTYTRVNLGIEIQDENDKPSVVAEGVYTNDVGVTTPVRFEFNSGEVFEANSNGPVTLTQETPATAKIKFDPHVWFSTITKTQLNNATRTNGVIIISETINAALFDIVADKLDDATEAVFQ